MKICFFRINYVTLQIYLTNEYTIEKANCKCPRGLEICHHIAAAMFASRYELSKTDVQCSWVPLPADNNVKSWKQLYNIPEPNRISQQVVCDDDVKEFAEELASEICCGFVWLLKDEPEKLQCMIAVDVESILMSDNYRAAADPQNYLKDRLKIDNQQITSIAAATVGQNSNIDWLQARKYRITASNFGALIGSIRRNRYSPSLFDKLMGMLTLKF